MKEELCKKITKLTITIEYMMTSI